MSTPANPSNSKPAGDDRNLVTVDEKYAALTFEDRAQRFWQNNQTWILAACVAVIIGFVGKGGWDYLARQRELDVEHAYAAAATPEQLKAFAAAHEGHSLAGLAQLRIADDACTAGKYAEALAAYEKALPALAGSPFAARAQLGRAMAKVLSGRTAEGTGELKQLSGDANQLAAIRAEATYNLASLAAEAGNTADVQKYTDQLMQIDPSSPWAQRGMMLRASAIAAPAAAKPAAAASAPATPAKTDDTSGSAPIRLPGK
ncbi:MAG TPA: tetratricopeptide repeat protein [Opitutaceae bacterium]|nr:tetratricopeptide repeat protein [Opitutaceae bacterium]